jgi:hypothetical protein
MEIDYITTLMNETQMVHRFTEEDGSTYGILVLGRGENLFFQQGQRAFICLIDAVHAEICSKSINKWNDGKKITPSEKSFIQNKLIHYYKLIYNQNATLC